MIAEKTKRVVWVSKLDCIDKENCLSLASFVQDQNTLNVMFEILVDVGQGQWLWEHWGWTIGEQGGWLRGGYPPAQKKIYDPPLTLKMR